MATISGCRHLKVNLKAKIYIYVNSTTQRCPNKIIKIFLLEGFFHLPPVSLTPVANLGLRISLRVLEKIRNGPNGIIRGLGETDSRKKQKQKISWHCPFKLLPKHRINRIPEPIPQFHISFPLQNQNKEIIFVFTLLTKIIKNRLICAF